VSEDIATRARRTLEVIFPTADVAALTDVVHPDCVNHEAPPGVPPDRAGMTQIMLWLNRAFSDLRYDIHQVIAQDDRVAIYCTMTGRHTGEFMGVPPTNARIAVKQVHIVRFEDGLGIEHWAVRDDLALMRQLGVLPAERPPQAAGAAHC
jgi:predicted ester cyclase